MPPIAHIKSINNKECLGDIGTSSRDQWLPFKKGSISLHHVVRNKGDDETVVFFCFIIHYIVHLLVVVVVVMVDVADVRSGVWRTSELATHELRRTNLDGL
jgi:uncharacterized protein with von Willebrand factor type A (vWA) domain